jgi:dihydropteroate synthase
MGILNVTPDSFSDGGHYHSPEAASQKARELVAEGADIIDIGAESTAPGSSPLSAAEEWRRLEPVLQALLSAPFPPGVSASTATSSAPLLISVDTYKASIAERALKLGAVMINDVSGLRADQAMAEVVASHSAYLVIMHSKETGSRPHASDIPRHYEDIVGEIASSLRSAALTAEAAGVKADQIILDPGIGRFISLDPADSWELLRRYRELCELLREYPVLVATSRKGFLGGTLEERDPVSQLTALHALKSGAKVVRTHCPGMMRAFLRAADELVREAPEMNFRADLS